MFVRLYGVNANHEGPDAGGRICHAEDVGNAECSGEIDEPSTGSDPDSVSSASSRSGNSCASQEQCGDLADGLACATDLSDLTNLSHLRDGFPDALAGTPAVASWGTFKCQSIYDLAASAALVYTLGSACRGRCLLQSNGSLAITDGSPIANGSETTANITSLPTRDLPKVEHSVMSCPCNCTYVSPSCCLATDHIVYEGPADKTNVLLLGEPGTCCDHNNGSWTGQASTSGQDKPVQDPECKSAPPAAAVQTIPQTLKYFTYNPLPTGNGLRLG